MKKTSELQGSKLTSEGRLLVGVLAGCVAVAVVAAIDVASDLVEGTPLGHVLAEGFVVTVGLIGAFVMARRLTLVLRRERLAREGEVQELHVRLAATEDEARRWRDEARDVLGGLGAALDRQFERWALTAAEKEVALLLLKGLSHKEIGEARSVTEATARQQSRAVYKKARLTGRNDLAAFFLEDLLLPAASADTAAGEAAPPRRRPG